MNVFLVLLTYDVHFDDADNGNCFAGDGARVIKAFADKRKAEGFVAEWLPIIRSAEGENTVCPVQSANRKLKHGLGFTLHDFAQAEENYNLAIHEEEVEEFITTESEHVPAFGAFEFTDGFMHPGCVDLIPAEEKRLRKDASPERRELGALIRVYAPGHAPAGSVCLVCKKGIT